MGFDKRFPVATKNQMELLALVEGIQMVSERSQVPVDINVDSNNVIIMLREDNLHYNAIIYKCRLLIIGMSTNLELL